MILLTSTSDAIQIVTGAAVNSINVQASWVDLNGTTMIPGRTNTLISSATTTTVIAPPAANTERSMKNLSIYNSSAVDCKITVQHTDGTNVVDMFSYNTLPSESVHWSEGRGWYVLDSEGNLKTVVTATTPSIDFENVTSGTNISADMVVGTGAILEYSGTGQINANEIGTINIDSNLPVHAGQLLISQPGNTTAVWADPLVQGLYPDGTLVSTPINPVYVGGQSTDGKLYGLLTDASKNLLVSVAVPVPILGAINNYGVSTGTAQFSVDPYGRQNLISTGLLNDTIVGLRQNQVEVNFSQPNFDNGNVTNTVVLGGTATQPESGSPPAPLGYGLYETGTNAGGSATGVAIQNIIYRPGSEIFSEFTAAWINPQNNSRQHIGGYTSNPNGNGFFLGFQNGIFAAGYRNNGVNTYYYKASWIDPLDGSAGSKFTRAGVPEAINFANLNIFRIRWSWFGAGPIQWEVFSPDGYWIVFNRLSYPNTEPYPHTTNSNVSMRVDVENVGNTSNTGIITCCWACGTTNSEIKLSEPITNDTLATVTRTAIVAVDTNDDWHNIQCSPDGSLNVNSLSDGVSVTGAATWTQATPINTTLMILDGSLRYSSLLVTYNLSGTFTGGAAVVQGSNDNINWFGLIGWDINIEDVITGTVGGFSSQGSFDAQQFNCSAWSYIRVVLYPAITGTGSPTVTVGYALQSTASLVQLAAIFTPLICMTYDAFENPITSTAGALDVNIKSGNFPSVQTVVQQQSPLVPWVVDFSSPQHVIVDSGAISVSGSVGITGTVAVTQSTSPWIVAGGGTAGASGTAVLTVQGIAGGTAIPITGTVTTSGTATVIGTLTNNNAAPSTANIGVLSALANAAAPSWTEGDQVLLSVDKSGNQRVILNAETTKVIGTVNIAASQTIAVTQATASSLNATVTRATPLTSAYSYAAISTAANPAVFVAAVGGQTVRIYRILIVNAGTATNVTMEDSTPTAFSGAVPLVANGSLQADGDGDPLWVTASGKAFQAVNSASQSLVGEVWFTQS